MGLGILIEIYYKSVYYPSVCRSSDNFFLCPPSIKNHAIHYLFYVVSAQPSTKNVAVINNGDVDNVATKGEQPPKIADFS